MTGFPGGSVVKNLPANAGDVGLIPDSGRSSGEGNGYPLQYSCLEKSHGQRSLVGYSPGGHKELDSTEHTVHTHTYTHTHTHTHRSNLLYINYTAIQLFFKRQSYTSPPVHSTKIQTYSGLQLIKLINKSRKNSNCIICLSSVQSLSHVRLFATTWTTARQASLSTTNSRSSLRLRSSASRGSKKYTQTQELCESFSLKNFLNLNHVFSVQFTHCRAPRMPERRLSDNPM